MERHDRGAGSAPVNGVPGRRNIHHATAISNGSSPPPPVPSLRKAMSNSNLSASGSVSGVHVVGLVREAMRTALEGEKQVTETGVDGTGINTGVTVDLSRKNIQKLPDEVVDILKNGLERLALSHNQLTSLPLRFSECTSLRYLNIRANQMTEFPTLLCELTRLEILDLGRNQISVLPPEISRLSSLKVLSIRRNRIQELPSSLAEMGSLQVLKLEGNPLTFPPQEVLTDGFSRDSELNEVAMTANIKRFMRQHIFLGGRHESGSTGDELSEGAETPRAPLKRVVSGRFPIRVNGSDDMRSPSVGRAPPIPNRSHYRGLSQQSTTMRRPGVMPLTLGNANERLRSNSETIIRTERSESRNRRKGLIPKKSSDLGTLDETQANNRFSHYRGLSHESAMQSAPIIGKDMTGSEPYPQRPVYVRRLSVLPERRRESKIYDPIIEAAKGILYSVFQIHPMIQMLLSLTNDGSEKRSSLEIVFYNTNSHVEELEQEIQKYEATSLPEDEQVPRENESVHRACQTLVGAYGHVCTLLAGNIDTFVDNGDPRYIRTLLMLLYNSIMELRVTLSSLSQESEQSRSSYTDSIGGGLTLRPHTREPSTASTTSSTQRQYTPRSRTGTMVHNPSNLRVATDVPMPSPFSNPLRKGAQPLASATPRSGESFISINSRDVATEVWEEDAQFERIFLSLQRSADVVLQTLPNFNIQLAGGLTKAVQSGVSYDVIQNWKRLIAMVGHTVQQTEILKSRLSAIKLKEPGLRLQASFWNLCTTFVCSWFETAHSIRSSFSSLPLPNDTRARLKPIQQSMKATSSAIERSPWHFMYRPPGASGHSSQLSGPMSPIQLPITPQSAALGPAMQATVPKTPQSKAFASAFHGNVFDRADALMANPGISMSRPGMPRKGHSAFSSLSSVS